MVAPSWGGITGGAVGLIEGEWGETGRNCMEARAGPRPEPRTHSTAPSRPRRDAARPAGSAHVSPGDNMVLAHRHRHKQEETRGTESLSWGQTSLWDVILHRSWLTQFWLVRFMS